MTTKWDRVQDPGDPRGCDVCLQRPPAGGVKEGPAAGSDAVFARDAWRSP